MQIFFASVQRFLICPWIDWHFWAFSTHIFHIFWVLITQKLPGRRSRELPGSFGGAADITRFRKTLIFPNKPWDFLKVLGVEGTGNTPSSNFVERNWLIRSSSFYFSRHLIVDFFLSEGGVDWGLRKSVDPNGKSGRLCSRWSTLTPPKMTLMMTATIIHTDPSTSEDQDENPERFWTALLILLPSSKLT